MSDRMPSLVYVSPESYRMFKAMCKEEKVDEEKDEKAETVKRPKDLPFTRYVQAFLFAAAIGIGKGDRIPPGEKKRWVIRGEYLNREVNYGKFKQLLKSLHNPRTEAELVGILAEYAEAGVKDVYNEFSTTGRVNFLRYAQNPVVNSG